MTLDDRIREALAPLRGDPERDAVRVLAAIRNLPAPRPAPPPGRTRWWPVLVAAAAGLLAGWLLHRPEPTVPAPGPEEGPRLLACTGPIEAVSPARKGGDTLLPGAGFRIGDTVFAQERAQGELDLGQGRLLRLDSASEVATAPEAIEVVRGRVLALASAVPLRVRAGGVEATVLRGAAAFTRERDATRVLVLRGRLRLHAADGRELELDEHQGIEVIAGAFDRPYTQALPEMSVAWQAELLAVAGREKELAVLLERLYLAALLPPFDDKALHALRQLGSGAMPRLAALLRTMHKNPLDPQRVAIAGVIADHCDRRALDALFALLPDPSPKVRLLVYRALVRLTGGDGGIEERDVETMDEERLRKVAAAWADSVR